MVYILEMASGLECPDDASDYRTPKTAPAAGPALQACREELGLALQENRPDADSGYPAYLHLADMISRLED